MKQVSHVRYDGEGNAVVVYVDMTSEPMSEAAAMALGGSRTDRELAELGRVIDRALEMLDMMEAGLSDTDEEAS